MQFKRMKFNAPPPNEIKQTANDIIVVHKIVIYTDLYQTCLLYLKCWHFLNSPFAFRSHSMRPTNRFDKFLPVVIKNREKKKRKHDTTVSNFSAKSN